MNKSDEPQDNGKDSAGQPTEPGTDEGTGVPEERDAGFEPGASSIAHSDSKGDPDEWASEPIRETERETEREPIFPDSPASGRPVSGPKPSRGLLSSLIGWLGFLLALVAIGGLAYLLWQTRDRDVDAAGNEAAIASLSDNLDEAVGSVRDLEGRIAELEDADRQNSEDLSSLDRELDQSSRQFETVAPRIGNLESALSSLRGVSAGVRDTWILAEAEYYMQIANAQLELAGNPEIAALALNFADERIRQLADPALSDVRRALTEELQALASIEEADLEGMTLALASLAERIGSLPLEENVEPARDDAAPPDPELSGFARAAASIRKAFSGMVSVRRADEALTPLLSPDAAYFLRENLALRIQAARLALLKGEQAVFEQCLEDAEAWLQEYYDTGSRAVASALTTIAELKGNGLSVSLPDISGSLRLLRQYRTLRDAESQASGERSSDSRRDNSSVENTPDTPEQ
ncbi:MAG TPA: uroporphyrinogen-III C-methyltransferase [Woeseiaceae bacterium]|nr:uroporphyrinogen-III C-methyltransferase [Woeseiaceae bacterium]